MKPELSLDLLLQEAGAFSGMESSHSEPTIYGITDGKAIGTYFEHKFQDYLGARYSYEQGSSARGIDLPGLQVDMKVTRITQPQSSCPYRSAKQKVYGPQGVGGTPEIDQDIDDKDAPTTRTKV